MLGASCDVVGFTPLSKAQDAKAVRELLSQYFAVARTVVGRYGGVVEKFIGTPVMVMAGGPPAATEETPSVPCGPGLSWWRP